MKKLKKLLIILGFLIVPSAVGGMFYVQRKHALADDLAQARELLGTRQGKELIPRLADKYPDSAEMQFLCSRELGLDGDASEGQIKLTRAGALGYPEDQVTRQRWLLTAITNFPKARPVLETMLVANPDDRDVAMSLALGYDQVNRQKAAELLATRILERNPNDGVALCLRGKIRLKNNDTQRAEQDLKKAVALGKDRFYSFAARMYWAECLQKLDDVPRAYQLFKECKTERPDSAQAQLRFGSSAKSLEHFDEAMEAFQEVLRLQPGDIDALLEMVNIYIFRKEYDKALEILKRVEASYADDITMLVQSAKIYRLKGDAKRAEEYEKRHKEWVERMEKKGKGPAPEPAEPPSK